MAAYQSFFAASPEPVPVQLTSLVPVRVMSVHGDFFDTELHQDAPMRILQQAVEDCFKVRPELQLLTHNRQQVNPNVSLRQNGCLLLKGDPYVKIVVDVKKGTKLNLVCHMQHYEPVPLACEAADTVWEVKKKFCTAVAKTGLTPQRIRLLWRYWELNDKATLDYYRLPTNAKLSVMKKRGFSANSQPRGRRYTSDSPAQAARNVGATAVASPPKNVLSSRMGTRQVDTSAGTTPLISPWPVPSRPLGHAVIPIDPAADHRSVSTITDLPREANAHPAKDAELAMISQSAGLVELAQLKEEIALLDRRIAAHSIDRSDYEFLQESYRATLGRVGELEATIGRFQHLLQRALTLM